MRLAETMISEELPLLFSSRDNTVSSWLLKLANRVINQIKPRHTGEGIRGGSRHGRWAEQRKILEFMSIGRRFREAWWAF